VQSGEDFLAACSECHYAANLEVAISKPDGAGADPAKTPAHEAIPTPNQRTIEEVSAFLGASPDRFLKSLLYVAENEVIMAVVRGDHEINEVKLARAIGVGEVFLAGAEDVKKATGAEVGFAGPVGFRGRLVVDRDAAAVIDGITGANRTDYHFKHV